MTIVVGVCLAQAAPVAASHFVGAPAPERTVSRSLEPSTSVNVETQATSFSEGDFEGTFWTFAARGEYRWRAFGAHVRVPLHTLSMNDRNRTTGLGDVVVGASWLAVRGSTVSAGLTLDGYLPSGDSHQGLGQGSLAAGVTAHVVARLPHSLQLGGTLGGLAGGAADGEALFVEQRAEAELRAGVSLFWRHGRVRLGARTSSILPLAPMAARGSEASSLALRASNARACRSFCA
jgi:hypothetical protein